MHRNKWTTALMVSLLLICVSACTDHLRDGVAAYKAGNFTVAMQELTPVAEAGNAEAQLFIGFMYDNGEGVTQDYPIAVAWYGKAADQGEPAAQYNLAMLYGNGLGVRQDWVQALKLLNLAAIAGHAKAKEARIQAMSNMSPEQIKEAESLVEQWLKSRG